MQYKGNFQIRNPFNLYKDERILNYLNENQPGYKIYDEICSNLASGMSQKKADVVFQSLNQLYNFLNNKINYNFGVLLKYDVIQYLIFIFNSRNIFGLCFQELSIKIMNILINKKDDIAEIIISNRMLPALFRMIEFCDKRMCFEILYCFTKLAEHCQNCQDNVIKFAPLQKITEILNMNDNDLFDISLNFLVTISKYPLDSSVVEYCFCEFIYILDKQNYTSWKSILGIAYLIEENDISNELFYNSNLNEIITITIISNDYLMIQATLFLISNIYKMGLNVLGMSFIPIIGKLHFNYSKDYELSNQIVIFTATAIKNIAKQDVNYINIMIENGLFEATNDVFQKSSFIIKRSILDYLYCIVKHGCSGNRSKLIDFNILEIFLEMIELGEDSDILKGIKSISYCFEENTREKCIMKLQKIQNSEIIFYLPQHFNKEIADFSSVFIRQIQEYLNEKQ